MNTLDDFIDAFLSCPLYPHACYKTLVHGVPYGDTYTFTVALPNGTCWVAAYYPDRDCLHVPVLVRSKTDVLRMNTDKQQIDLSTLFLHCTALRSDFELTQAMLEHPVVALRAALLMGLERRKTGPTAAQTAAFEQAIDNVLANA